MFGKMVERMKGLWKDEAGQGLAEYGIIIAVMVGIVIVVLTAFGDSLQNAFDTIGQGVEDKAEEATD